MCVSVLYDIYIFSVSQEKERQLCVCVKFVIQEKIVKILTRCWNLLLKQVLGTDELTAYLHKYRIELDPHLAALVGR